MIEFKNGSKISSIPAKNVRGVRSNFISMPCLDIETGEMVFKTLDMREPIDRYIPEYILEDYK